LLATITNTLSVELLSSHLTQPIQSWAFDPSFTKIAIGRCTSNHIVIDSTVVSRYHLVLEKLGNTWHLRSLGKNGCYINGRPVNNLALSSGATLVRLGQTGSFLRLALGAPEQEDLNPTPQPTSKKRIFVGKAARDFVAKRERAQAMERTQTIDPRRASRNR